MRKPFLPPQAGMILTMALAAVFLFVFPGICMSSSTYSDLSIPELLGLLESPDDETVSKASVQLRSIGNPAVPSLIETLKNHGTIARMNAVSLLGSIGDPRAVPPLIGIITNPNDDQEVQQAVPAALGKIGLPAVGPLITIIKNTSSYYPAHWILESFVAIGPSASGPLISALENNNPLVRARLVWALSSTRNYRANKAVSEATSDPDDHVRSQARLVLEVLNDLRRQAMRSVLLLLSVIGAFMGVIIGLVARRQNRNPWLWGVVFGLAFPSGGVIKAAGSFGGHMAYRVAGTFFYLTWTVAMIFLAVAPRKKSSRIDIV